MMKLKIWVILLTVYNLRAFSLSLHTLWTLPIVILQVLFEHQGELNLSDYIFYIVHILIFEKVTFLPQK